MKKIMIIVICFIFAISVAGCRKENDEHKSYRFERSGIKEISGTSQMSDNVKNIVLSDEEIPKLLNQLDSLLLEETNEKNEHNGWEFFFLIAYDDDKSVNINLSKERIVIDGYVYNTELYNEDDFLAYFE